MISPASSFFLLCEWSQTKFRPVLVVAAWFWLLVLPSRLPTPTLDPSWQAVLNYGAVHRLQHGVDIVFTYGPLGYLMQNSFCSGTWPSVLVFQAVSRALYLALVCRIARTAAESFGGGAKIPRLVFVSLAAWMPALDTDSFYLLFMTFAGALLCSERAVGQQARPGAVELDSGVNRPEHLNSSKREARLRLLRRRPGLLEVACILLLGVFALLKTTFLAFGVVVIACAVLWGLMSRRWVLAICVPAGFAAAVLFAWRLLGQQQFANLPAWLRGTAETANSYQQAMGVLPNWNQLVGGTLALLIVAAALASVLRRSRNWLPVVLLILCGLWLAWKQSFTRGDEYHARTFFIYVLTVFAALPLLVGYVMNHALAFFMAGLCLGSGLLYRLPVPIYRTFENARFIVRLPRMEKIWARHALEYDLPEMRAIIGSSTVDVDGGEQAIAILNRLNYHPAPVFQSYAAGTPWLAQLNAGFYMSERAPDFIIRHGYTIDDRLPNLDDSISGMIIAQRYQPVASEKGFRLLRRVAGSRQPSEVIASGIVQAGERFSVNGGQWCEITMAESLLGRLARTLWMSPPISMEVWRADGTQATYRFVPSMGKSGFLVPEGAAAFRLSKSPAVRFCFRSAIGYRLCRVPGSL